MPKRCIALMCPLLLLFCACGRTQPAEPQNSAAAPAAFSLPSLPDIGRYQPKQTECFYDAPLREFKASKDYGAIIPYKAVSDVSIEAYGFMTADGKVLTAPVYRSVEPIRAGEQLVYAAECKIQYFTPGQKAESAPDLEEDNEEAFFIEEETTDTQYQLITGDGGKLLTLPLNFAPQTYYNAGGRASWIECSRYSEDTECYEVYYYGFDLLPLPALRSYRSAPGGYFETLAENAGEIVLAEHTDTYDGAAGESKQQTRILTFQNGSLKKEIALNEHVSAAANGLLIGDEHVFDRDGNALFETSWEAGYWTDSGTGRFYFADPQNSALTIIKNGKTEKSAALPETEYGYTLECAVVQDKTCLLLKVFVNAEDVQFLLFDTELRLLHTFDPCPEKDAQTCYADDSRGVRYIKIEHDGKADVYSPDGELLICFLYDWENDSLWMNDECVYYSGNDGTVRLFFPADGSTKEYHVSVPQAVGTVDEANAAFFDYRYWIPQEEDLGFSWRRNDTLWRLYDAQTGELLYDNVSEFQWLDAEKRNYCTFSCSGCTYVADKNLQVIALIPDGYYA